MNHYQFWGGPYENVNQIISKFFQSDNDFVYFYRDSLFFNVEIHIRQNHCFNFIRLLGRLKCRKT